MAVRTMIISTRAALGTEALATLAAVEVSLESIECQPVVNFSFDFHQFLLIFIDIFKALESVTTLSSYFKANTSSYMSYLEATKGDNLYILKPLNLLLIIIETHTMVT